MFQKDQSRRSFAGAWIEIQSMTTPNYTAIRRSFAGAWIEIYNCIDLIMSCPVAPSQERGLKYTMNYQKFYPTTGRSFAGAWIEIPPIVHCKNKSPASLLRRSVD